MHSQLPSFLLAVTLPLAFGAPAATPPNGYGADFKFPLANGFPNPSQSAISKIESLAGGTLPNGAAPSSPGSAGILDFQVIATNELFEVAYFTELLYNVTNGVEGYGTGSLSKSYVEKSLMAIKNVSMHSTDGSGMLVCAYDFNPLPIARRTPRPRRQRPPRSLWSNGH